MFPERAAAKILQMPSAYLFRRLISYFLVTILDFKFMIRENHGCLFAPLGPGLWSSITDAIITCRVVLLTVATSASCIL